MIPGWTTHDPSHHSFTPPHSAPLCSVSGFAGPHIDTTAFGLYQLSAELGNSHSLLMTGDKAFYGKGTGQNWVRAAAIYYEVSLVCVGCLGKAGAGV